MLNMPVKYANPIFDHSMPNILDALECKTEKQSTLDPIWHNFFDRKLSCPFSYLTMEKQIPPPAQ